MKTFYFLTAVLIISIFINKVLIACKVRKIWHKMRIRYKEKLRKCSLKNRQLDLKDQAQQAKENELNEKDKFVKNCYEQAKQAAQKALTTKKQNVALELEIANLKKQLTAARQNSKRRKKQLEDLKLLKE